MTSERLTLPAGAQLEEEEAQGQTTSWLAALPLTRLQLPLLLLLTLLLLIVAYQLVPAPTVTVGPLDQRFISATNAREYIPDLGREVRWTTADTRLDMPLIAERTPLILELALVNSYPRGLPPPTVDVALEDRWLAEVVVPREIEGGRHVRLLLPEQQRAGWNLPIYLYSSTIELENDPRPLGVMLLEARLGTLAMRPLLPPLWQMFAMLVVAAAGYFTLRGVGGTRWLSWAVAAAAVGMLVLGLVVAHIQIAPYTMRLAGLASLGALYGLAAWLLTEIRAPPVSTRSTILTVETAPARPAISTGRLVLLMGLAFWLMPVYQLIMTADGAPNVTPYPPTFWLGAVTVFASIIGVGLLFDIGRGQHWQPLLLAVLAVAAVLHTIIMIQFSLGRSGPDFWILFRGARDWFRGGSMYNLEAVQTNHFGHVFKVPPFYGMLFLPFVQQDGLMILFWHRVMNIVLLVLTLLVLLRAYGIRIASAVGAGLLLLFTMRPITDTIAFGQIDIMLLLLLVLALVASQHRQGWLAGALVALGTLFKLYPALLLVFFLVKRQWGALVGFATAMLVLNGMAVAVVGWEMHRVYLLEVLPRIGGGTTWVENQTINGFVSRMVAGDIDAAPFNHPLVSIITYGGFLLALAGAVWLARRPVERKTPRYMLQYSLFIILMVLAAPAAWMHYQTIVLLPFFALLCYSALNGDMLPRWQAALLGIAYALIGYGNQWSFFDSTIMGHLSFVGVSYKFYGLLLLLVVTVACLLNRRQDTEYV